MTSDKTLRERIAEWRAIDKRYNDADQLRACADELTPIAEALEAVVREMEHERYAMGNTTDRIGHDSSCVRCRLERIVGKNV